MKKLFFLMAAGLLVLSSCSLKHDSNGNDAETRRKVIAMSMHNSNIGQVQVNLDPFNVAFRLNTLLVESEAHGGDVNAAALNQMRQDLFGAQTTITVNQGVYTIAMQGQGKYDYLRTGTLVVNTYGSTLSNGNSWTLDIPESAKYSVSISGIVALHVSSYTITATEDNTWEIRMSELVSNQPEQNQGKPDTDKSGYSNWGGKITIKQNMFDDQTLASVSKSTYSMEIESDHQIKTMFVTDTMSVVTTAPLMFNPECSQGHIVGSGSMKSSFTFPWSNPLDFTLSEWKGEGVKCDPEIEVLYYGTVQE